MRPPADPEVIFFDIGGTLLSFSIEPSALFSLILADHGVAVEPPAVYRAMRAVEAQFPLPPAIAAGSEGEFWRAIDEKILERLGVPPTRGILEDVARRFRAELTLECFEESVEVLEVLRDRGVPLGVISNASHGILGDIERNRLSPFFRHIVYSQAVGASKPDPRIFEAALARFGAEPSRTWHVGDSPAADVEGARGVGIHPVLVDRAQRFPDVEAARVRDLRGVVRLLEGA